ncbi:tetratricopeptide repeat protein [Pedobacter sp. BS3]|uniref:tetratricopeptide repeat protein n=1 Tax=Pedobacter sp. BS3 TaxID=2567937 RepID=UPI0011F063A2|nr:tetratricopeptide repeat protein [Pedobacter sp. BS3]TZF83573.1 tetratricopeptide repeat protein [Pedobacter sp. BS3]
MVFPKAEKDSLYGYGFIYLDVVAGPTVNYEGKIKVNGAEIEKIIDPSTLKAGFKYRLGQNTRLVHILSSQQVEKLQLKPVPDWLSIYKSADNSTYQTALGSMYNAVGRSDMALPLLEAIYQKDTKNQKLVFELAFAYNALQNYKKAIDVLVAALKQDPDNALYYKELVYSYCKLNNPKQAEDTYTDFLQKAHNKTYQYEMAYNIMYQYFLDRNRAGFDKWASVVEASRQAAMLKNLEAMRQDWDKK